VARRSSNTSAAATKDHDEVDEPVGASLSLAPRSRPSPVHDLVLLVDCAEHALRVLARPGAATPRTCPACDPTREKRARTQPRIRSKKFRVAAAR